VRLDAAGVHPGQQEVHDIALAGPLDAADEDDGRERGAGQLLLRLEERRADQRHLAVVRRLVNGIANFCSLEHGPPPSGRPYRGRTDGVGQFRRRGQRKPPIKKQGACQRLTEGSYRARASTLRWEPGTPGLRRRASLDPERTTEFRRSCRGRALLSRFRTPQAWCPACAVDAPVARRTFPRLTTSWSTELGGIGCASNRVRHRLRPEQRGHHDFRRLPLLKEGMAFFQSWKLVDPGPRIEGLGSECQQINAVQESKPTRSAGSQHKDRAGLDRVVPPVHRHVGTAIGKIPR
jgi:hypothetical protein